MRRRLKNMPLTSVRPLPSTSSVADITRTVLSSVYQRVTPEKDSEWSSPELSAHVSGDVRARTLVARWKQHSLKDVWRESACTLRYAFIGAEFACIPKKEIKGIGHYSSAAFICQGAHEVIKAHLIGTSLR